MATSLAAISAEARAVHEAALIVDLHCDLLLTTCFLGWSWSRRHRRNPLPRAALMGHVDLPRLRDGNVGCLSLGLVINPLRRRSAPGAVVADLDRMDRAVAGCPGDLVVARTPEAIRAARAEGKVAVLAGLEGAHSLQGSLEPLTGWRARGLGYVGLAHFTANAACRPMVGWGANRTEGLSAYGRALVAELNRLGVLVDVAHVNAAGLRDACDVSRAPVICSHTACNAVHRSVRGLEDEQIRAVARTGGVVGVIFVTPFIGPGGLSAVVAHLDHLKRLVGPAHVGLGTDWEGWSLYPRELDGADRLPLLTEALLRARWTPDEILALYGENFMRVLGAAQDLAA